MTLSFPNRSRCFDEARSAVRFIGHDGMFEVPFFIETKALVEQASTELTELDYLTAFDQSRGSIYDVARKLYRGMRGKEYILTMADFE